MAKPSVALLKSMDAYAEDISFVCGDPLFEDELEDEMLLKLKETFFVKEARSCTDWVERDFFNTGGVKGRTEFSSTHLLDLRRATRRLAAGRRRRARAARREEAAAVLRRLPRRQEEATGVWQG